MPDKPKEKILFPNNTNYQIGAVTYQVAAYFSENGKTLKSKINHLIAVETQKSNSRTFAAEEDSII